MLQPLSRTASKDSYVFDDKYKEEYYGYYWMAAQSLDDSDTKGKLRRIEYTHYRISSSTEKITSSKSSDLPKSV